jgi:NTP pyrophosphatase (non-canonical NTP hydrolase)
MTQEPSNAVRQLDTDDFVSIQMIHKDPEVPPAAETIRYDDFVRWLFKPGTEQVSALHSAIGVAGEAGELADAIKKEYIYGKPRDLENIIEELGDLEWYLQSVRNHYGFSRKQILQANADKLAKRYVNLRYSDAAAINRADKKEN